ncbi:MAG: HEPN domain-containing protein [Halobacteria archaeon]
MLDLPRLIAENTEPPSPVSVLTFGLVLFLSVSLASVTVTANSPSDGINPTRDSPLKHGQVTDPPPFHRPPDRKRPGKVESLVSWLSNRMDERLEKSAIGINRSRYEKAKDLLGDDYDSYLGKIVEVEDGTNKVINTFKSSSEGQKKLTDEVEKHRKKLDEYREARNQGNEDRAERLSRDIRKLNRSISRTSNEVINDLEFLGNETDFNMTRAVKSIQNVRNETSYTTRDATRDVISEKLVETNISVFESGRTGSYFDPFEIKAAVNGENGSRVESGELRLDTGVRTFNRSLRNMSGRSVRFDVKPTVERSGERNWSLQYVPSNTTMFGYSKRTVEVYVVETEANLTIDRYPEEELRYGDILKVAGDFSYGGKTITDFPVKLEVSDQYIDGGFAGESGYNLNGSLPAGVPLGDRTLTVSPRYEDRAVTAESMSRSVEIHETPTILTMELNQTGDSVTVAGGLLAVVGLNLSYRTVPGARVKFLVNGTTVNKVSTDGNGGYVARLREGEAFEVTSEGYVDPYDNVSESLNVTAVFSGKGNLMGDSITRNLSYSKSETGSGAGIIKSIVSAVTESRTLYILMGLFILVAISLFIYLRKEEYFEDDESPELYPEASEPVSGSVGDVVGEDRADEERLNEAITAIREGNQKEAVELSHRAVNRKLRSLYPVDSPSTHREIYTEIEKLDKEGMVKSEFETLTEYYEKSEYSPEKISKGDAEEALNLAEEIVKQVSVKLKNIGESEEEDRRNPGD